MSKFIYYALVWVMVGVMVKLLIPECSISDQIIGQFITQSGEGYDIANSTLSALPVLGVGSDALKAFIGTIVLIWNAFSMVLDVLLMPIGLINYMNAEGAPAEATMVVAVPYAAMIILTVIDFIRSGS